MSRLPNWLLWGADPRPRNVVRQRVEANVHVMWAHPTLRPLMHRELRLRVEAEAEEALQFAFSHFFIVAWSARSTETTHSSPMRRASAA